jgi:hypothetical protein
MEECIGLIRDLFTITEKIHTEIDDLKAKLNQDSQNSNRSGSMAISYF